MKKVIIEKELGAMPSTAEMEVVDILVMNKIPKKHIIFLKPNRTKGAKTPDLQIDDEYWEIKGIKKLGKYTLDHAERTGLKQASNLIFDLRKLDESLEKKAIKRLKSDFERTKIWRGMIVIVRFNGKCLILRK